MTRKTQVIHLFLFLAGLTGLNAVVNGSLAPPTGDVSIWYHGGLLMLILGTYWIEPYFTKPADVVINGLVVFIATSTLQSPPFAEWWTTLRYFSLACVVAAFLVVWSGSPALPGYDTSLLKRLAYLTVTRVGSATVLFSCVFLLALLSYFEPGSTLARWMLLFWATVVLTKHLELENFLRSLFTTFRRAHNPAIGRLSRFSEPNIARFEVLPGQLCPRGSVVAFTASGLVDTSCLIAVVVGHRSAPTRVESEAILLDSEFAEGCLEGRQVVVRVDTNDPEIRKRLVGTFPGLDMQSVVGFAARESDIARLRFELRRAAQLEEGYLVAAASLDREPILYQIVDGALAEEAGLETGRRAFTIGDAQQLGTWDVERQGFASHSWVVPEHAPVIVQTGADVQRVLKPGLVEVGVIPNSAYPANVRITDLVLFHSAILGVTGSGKSFLAYYLIEKCAEAGIKVICLDLTGDYQRYLGSAVRLSSTGAMDPFLSDPQTRIGIIEFSDSATHPIALTEVIAQRALNWCRKNRSESEVSDPSPKVLLVLEEAHSLVPEWNSSPMPTLREKVNATAQIALQARKYGLGFMIITQRTANVTKSILNQCNTIFAFQAYDETGFEFMRNYMGAHYVRALPNLKKRQGVIVGKASASDRPIIVRFQDQDRAVSSADLPTYAAASPMGTASSTP